jgi:hypothetical protein
MHTYYKSALLYQIIPLWWIKFPFQVFVFQGDFNIEYGYFMRAAGKWQRRNKYMKVRVLGVSGSEVPGHNLPAFLIDGSMLLDAGTVGQSLDSRAQ